MCSEMRTYKMRCNIFLIVVSYGKGGGRGDSMVTGMQLVINNDLLAE